MTKINKTQVILGGSVVLLIIVVIITCLIMDVFNNSTAYDILLKYTSKEEKEFVEDLKTELDGILAIHDINEVYSDPSWLEYLRTYSALLNAKKSKLTWKEREIIKAFIKENYNTITNESAYSRQTILYMDGALGKDVNVHSLDNETDTSDPNVERIEFSDDE